MTAATQNPLYVIERDYGQSIWLDNLSRNAIVTGELARQIETRGILGITSNPAIFEKAIVGNAIYDAEIEAGIRGGKTLMEIYETLIFGDIRAACQLFLPVYENSNGLDGYVSVEVPPTIATDTERTIAEARRYNQEIGYPNVMIKIPGTPEGLPAVEQAIAEGINVNVTLLFSVESYIATAWAYIRGLEKRLANGGKLDNIASVASFFLSRIDSNIDAQLNKAIAASSDTNVQLKLANLKGKVAIANAKIAYQKYKEIFTSEPWQNLAAAGAKEQRLLWASTGTKDPNYSDVMYVDGLVGANTVNTLPPQTLEACAEHCDPANRIESGLEGARQTIEALKDPQVNIDLDRVMEDLLEDGIDKFVKPFDSLMQSLQNKIDALQPVG